MDKKILEAFGDFWDRVGRAEGLIVSHFGPRLSPAVKEDMDQSWFELYEVIKPALEPFASPKSIISSPEAPGYSIYEATTYHEALMFELNPPEALFGLPHILTAPEYLKIKRNAHEEFRQIMKNSGIDATAKMVSGEKTSGDATADSSQSSSKAEETSGEFAPLRPRWDGERRELYFGNNLCKEYRVRAPNQISILEAFENDGWPKRIDDPISSGADNATRQRTSDAVRALNINDYIRFELAGDREGILWKPL
jgi:hypothetical protein